MADFLKKIQGLPENQRKIIFFVIMGLACVMMFFIGILFTQQSVKNIGNSFGEKVENSK